MKFGRYENGVYVKTANGHELRIRGLPAITVVGALLLLGAIILAT